MSLLKKAAVKAYDAATHKATVQIAGSLGVWLDDIRVATDIPAADVQPGRQCTVLFLDPSNQDDALVLTIQGALPSSGAGVTDHGALTGLGDDDHTQYGALAQAKTWTALQTFNAGIQLAAGQAVKDSGGTARYTPATSSPHNTLTGDVDITSGFLAVGNNAAPINTKVIYADHIFSLGSFGTGWGAMFNAKDQGSAGLALSVIGLDGRAENNRSGGTDNGVEGLLFCAAHNPTAAATTSTLRAIRLRAAVNSPYGSVPALEGLRVEHNSVAGGVAPSTIHSFRPTFSWSGNSPGTLYVYHSPALPAASVARYHAFWGDPVNPHLRCDGGNPPDAGLTTEGDSPLWLLWMENGSLTTRRVRWRQQSSLGSTDRVLIAA